MDASADSYVKEIRFRLGAECDDSRVTEARLAQLHLPAQNTCIIVAALTLFIYLRHYAIKHAFATLRAKQDETTYERSEQKTSERACGWPLRLGSNSDERITCESKRKLC